MPGLEGGSPVRQFHSAGAVIACFGAEPYVTQPFLFIIIDRDSKRQVDNLGAPA